MKFFTENRRIAIIVLIVSIIFSVTVGTYRSTKNLQENILTVYKDSGAASDMAILIDSASQVAAIYKAVYGDDEESSDVYSTINELSENDDPINLSGKKAGALKNSASVMYNSLIGSQRITDSQEFTLTKYYYDMLNAWTMLCENEEYANAAKQYNDAVSSVPLRFFGMDSTAVFG